MDECEKLCQRIAVMSAGKFYALGTISDLKKQYAVGFVLSVVVSLDATEDAIADLKEAIIYEFPLAAIREEFNVM